MGFLKRIFSLKSIRNKKKQKQKQQQLPPVQEQQQQQQQQHQQEQRRQLFLNSNEELQIIDDQEHEAAIGRLLRSSSARFAVVSELDYASLPPLPHPINNVVQTPAASTISLSSSSISQRGTYNVQVHRRKRHASTEFPFANRHLDDFKTPQRTRGATAPPKEHAHYLGLRSDPSVVSLLELYDEHGRVPEKAFSNSPPSPSPDRNQGRAQTRRSGSTLRQLLGAPSSKGKSGSNGDLTEGDISWAERFLGEVDSVSSQSSLPLRTPTTSQARFTNNPSRSSRIANNDSTDNDLSTSTVDNPAISSMEVELSMGSNSSVNLDSVIENSSPYINSATKSPQRASQVFNFLTQKRQSSMLDKVGLPLSGAPSISRSASGCSSTNSKQTCTDNASETSFEPSASPATPLPSRYDTQTPIPRHAVHTRHHSSHNSLASSRIPSPNPDRPRSTISHTGSERFSLRDSIPENEVIDQLIHREKAPTNEVKVLMSGPTKVIVTAPTPSSVHDTVSRIPRGPRRPLKKCSSSSLKHRPRLTERSNSGRNCASMKDSHTNVSNPHKRHRRTSSSSLVNVDQLSTIRAVERSSKSRMEPVSRKSSFSSREKENKSRLLVRAELPSTPIRSHSSVSDSRSLFRAIVTPNGYGLPSVVQHSPASSSELSPAGRQLMMDVRQQRMRAREVERERSKRRGERHGNAYVA
ncbi:hypothetical protein AX15_006541 [Amanita polypyramis BW_CC]|nr:hypothetical protein AX15_006541 [Amanita polypyramis BW_CC]